MKGSVSYGRGNSDACFVEWYRCHEGETERTFCFGSRAECEALAEGPPPASCQWHPIEFQVQHVYPKIA